jgi:hypothetical protein
MEMSSWMARASSKGAPAKAAAISTSVRAEFGAVLLIILAIPRLVRLVYPAIWVEDDFYLEAAWLVSVGMRPYVDFVHPHFPLLEYLSAGYLKIFGASHFSIEILNEAAIYATSLLTFKLAARVTTRRAAMSAAILYATSSLVFRYHVYERECFVAPLMLAAAILALDGEDGISSQRRNAWQALALVAACLIKLTAFIPVAVVIAFMAMVRRRWRDAITVAIAVGVAMIIATAICYLLYGREFLFQTFIFHFMKGRSDLLSVMAYPFAILDLQLPLFVIGCIAVRRELRANTGIMLVLAMVAAEYLFFGILSPTSWGHNFLEPLPFIAIVGGIGVDWIIGQAQVASGRTKDADSQAWMRLAGCGFFILISLLWIAPLENENWLQGSVYGFGFVPRDEVAGIGAALHDASRPDEDVLAPAFICFQANRREMIRFPETYGVLREAELEYQRDGFAKARADLGREDFFALLGRTAHFWRDPIIKSIQDGKLNAIIPDSPIQLLPLVLPPVLLPADFRQILVDNGFRPVFRSDNFILWKRQKENVP